MRQGTFADAGPGRRAGPRRWPPTWPSSPTWTWPSSLTPEVAVELGVEVAVDHDQGAELPAKEEGTFAIDVRA